MFGHSKNYNGKSAPFLGGHDILLILFSHGVDV